MDFASVFGGEALTLEQFNEKTQGMKLEDLASGGYVTKGKYDSDTKKLRDDLTEAKSTIASLESSKGDAAALQAELDKYKQAEARRQADEKAAAEHARVLERFHAAKGDKEFSSEYAESGAMDAFAKALADPGNVGKGDAELFDALTRDKEGVFKSAHPPVNMGGVKSLEQGTPTTLAGALRERYEQKG